MTTKQTTTGEVNKTSRPTFLLKLFNKLLPPYEPRIDLDEKLVEGEDLVEQALIRHYSEIQFIIGLILAITGLLLPSIFDTSYLYFLLIAGVFVIATSYEIEEILVTNRRILVRRIGLVERILRIPSDEEHAIMHIVSYQIGRAPINVIVSIIALIGYLVIFSESIQEFSRLLVFISATVILVYGLRLNRRALTINLAGGYQIIMGLRKGIPNTIIEGIQTVIYGQDQRSPFDSSQIEQVPPQDEDEKPVK